MAYKIRIQVLVVDDSAVFRELIKRGFSKIDDIEIVASAVDAYDAAEKLLQYHPDVMICDINMPRLNGIDFLKQLMPQYEVPTIVISTISNAVFDALEAGAVDFVSKPDIGQANAVKEFLYQLYDKVKIAAVSKINKKTSEYSFHNAKNIAADSKIDLIAIGASTGGIEATFEIIKHLSPKLPGIVIVQHIPPVFSAMYANKINTQTDFICKEAQSGDIVESGKIYIAPGAKHMLIHKKGNKYEIETKSGEKVNGHCPSVDVMFESLAESAKDRAIGIILTGMGYDGAKGLLKMKRRGARTIGQDESSSIVYGMPKAAMNIGAIEKQTSLNKIPNVIYEMLNKQSGGVGNE